MAAIISTTVKTNVLKLLEQNNITLEDFIKNQNIGAPIFIEIDVTSGACRVTGHLECIDSLRTALQAKILGSFTSSNETAISRKLLCVPLANEISMVENSGKKTEEFKSVLESSGSSDFCDTHSSNPSVNEGIEELANADKPRRIRKLKYSKEITSKSSATPEGASKCSDFETAEYSGSTNTTLTSDNNMMSSSGNLPVEKTVEEKNQIGHDAPVKGSITNEEICELVKNGQFISVDADKERHNYLMMHFHDRVNKEFAGVFEYEENGVHKVAIEPKVNARNAKTEIPKKYKLCLDLFCCEIYSFPVSFESSVMESIAEAYGIEHVSVIVCENEKSCKLFGCKMDVELMKIHIKEQLDRLQPQEEQWKQKTEQKNKQKAVTSSLPFVIKDGKALQPSPNPSKSDKGCLEVKVIEWKTDKLSADAVIFAVDSKLCPDRDSKAIQLPSDSNYDKDCKSILNRCHNTIPPMTLEKTDAPNGLKKVKSILHIVLVKTFDSKNATTTFEDTLKEGILKCLKYADDTMHSKALAIPHLCPGLCDVGMFVRSAMEALRCFSSRTSSTQKSSSLCSVIFAAKDSVMRQEMIEQFSLCIDAHSG